MKGSLTYALSRAFYVNRIIMEYCIWLGYYLINIFRAILCCVRDILSTLLLVEWEVQGVYEFISGMGSTRTV